MSKNYHSLILWLVLPFIRGFSHQLASKKENPRGLSISWIDIVMIDYLNRKRSLIDCLMLTCLMA